MSDREAETRGARSPRSQSRLEITPFHPYLRGERVSRKGASGIAWSRRDENILPEIPGSVKIERLEKDYMFANVVIISGKCVTFLSKLNLFLGKNCKRMIVLLPLFII